MKTLISIVGPTGIGKTRLAIELAIGLGTEIISCDSRQFFQEMRIGTAVPEPEELAAVPHHFIQHKSIHEVYSVGDFEREASALLDGLFLQYDTVIMVGGSGLYADALTRGLDEFPDVPEAIRRQLKAELDTYGIVPLQEELRLADPAQFERMDTCNPQRLTRALEVCRASGKPYSSFLKKNTISRPYEVLTVGLTAEREIVYHRIGQRVEKMLASGLLIEARQLMPFRKLNALQTVGYRELFSFFDRQCSLNEAVENIKTNTRRFAKRQYTWFNRNPDILWYDYQTPSGEILKNLK
ncbi:MAG: tRNA (adenosine(37)-N6)-dimethylallyltransferase MiaA [Capnocytophaga sp.]|nr:tRNA (adenosine(37)-N6)-dimethylallyltransferase MiaA [Capnocytophaga sp.]